MKKVLFMITLILSAFMSEARPAHLPTGKWQLNGNGHNGELYITSIDNQGKISGTMYGQQILGFWDKVSCKITLMRIIKPSDPSSIQIYTGYLFKHSGSLDGRGDVTYTLTGYFEAFAGTGATAQRTLYGWYAQIGIVQ